MTPTISAATSTVVLAVSQPTPDGGPFEQLAQKFLGLLWAFSGWVALGAFLISGAVYAYQKWTMAQTSALSMIGGVTFFVGCGATGAAAVNWAMSL
ncbi:hypothetical protein [Nocardia sp. alder85J]|uniref:hypothetical protein n=1 Tax=Nocardia sp. alder85J TaxID=2862949 RepID=UPI001CD6E0AF|nr:hypothetical protein [Nocardia sp. alder85J]MCX4099091.1 hypothetical protein [Nocardia sp. alder85J]